MSDNILYPYKPSIEAVNRFTDTLEELLSAHSLSVKVNLYDEPLRLVHFRGSQETGTDYLWIRQVLISTPEVENLEVNLFRRGIKEAMNPHEIWQEAHHIQEQLYQHLERNPVLPPSSDDDPYWALWDHLPNRKSS
ncbi:hypothetical protein ACFL26_01090 [Patescibacteria group bacterium]